MNFRVLGPLVVDSDGRPVAIGAARKPRLLLAILLANADSPVSADRLIDGLWPQSPPPSARRNVHLYVNKLRSALGADRLRQGYLIRDGEHLDSYRFRELARAGNEAAAKGDWVRASSALKSALDLWRGPAFADFADCELITAEAARLDELRASTQEQWAEAELALGRHEQVAPVLADLVREHPFREALCAQLMVALVGSGRQAEALETFRRIRSELDDELGVEPGPALQQLHQAILRGEALPARARVPHELPAIAAGFTGRVDELKELNGMLPDDEAQPVGIAVVAGTAGVGKTALAVRWAHKVADRFPDGQLYLDLRGYSDDEPLLPGVALAMLLGGLGVPLDQVPLEVSVAAARFRSLTADRKMLVLLDNARSAGQVRPLLPGGPGCLVIVTSRDRLSGLVAGEGARRLTLDPLSEVDAIGLLCELLGPQRVSLEQEAAVDLVTLCGRLPLALRVVAARLADRPHQTIASQVGEMRARNPVESLTIDGEAAVGAAFDTSYRTLPVAAQLVLRRLGRLALPDFTADSVAALIDVDRSVADGLLDRLAAAHFIYSHRLDRYQMHDLICLYAQTVDVSEDQSTAVQNLFSWYLEKARAAAKTLYPELVLLADPAIDLFPAPQPAVAWLNAERANIETLILRAARHGPYPMAWQLTDAMIGYFDQHRHAVDRLSCARAAVAAARRHGDLRDQAAAYQSLAHARCGPPRPPSHLAYLSRAASLAAQAGWVEGEAGIRANLAAGLTLDGDSAQAIGHAQRALALHREGGSLDGQLRVMNLVVHLLGDAGRLRDAIELAVEAQGWQPEARSEKATARILLGQGEVYHLLGELDLAGEKLTVALHLFQRLDNVAFEAHTMCRLSEVHLDAGHLEQAAGFAKTALDLGEDNDWLLADSMCSMAGVELARGFRVLALQRFRQALTISEGLGYPAMIGNACLGLAETCQQLADLPAAQAHAERALELSLRTGCRIPQDRATTRLAAIHLELGDAAHGRGLAEQVLARHRETGYHRGIVAAEQLLTQTRAFNVELE